MRLVTIRRWELWVPWMLMMVVVVLTFLWFQHGRLVSCKRTYEGTREIFRPFLTPAPKPGDGKRYADWVKFNKRVDTLKAGCSKQIRLWTP